MKQADVVLLGYPVPFPLSPQVRRQNLEMYEAVTSPQGPAMTWVRKLQGVRWWWTPRQPWPCPTGLSLPSPRSGPHPSVTSDLCPQSMFAVGWMELKDPGRAWDLLQRSFANVTEPFKVSLARASTYTPTTPTSCTDCFAPCRCGRRMQTGRVP